MTLAAQPRPGTSALGTLTSSFAGVLVGPDDASYNEVCRSLVWNGMHDRRPALIARCSSASDVQAALGYARSRRAWSSRSAAGGIRRPGIPVATAAWSSTPGR